MCVGNERWTLILRIVGGHKYYREKGTGKIAVADDSGRYPEDTDDGVLWLDDDRYLTVGDKQLWVPLKQPGWTGSTMEAAGDAMLIADALDRPLLDRHDHVWNVTKRQPKWEVASST